jgi:uncharacterized membrane protein YeaQ/YmgE (transglycosylase-associated protein family)
MYLLSWIFVGLAAGWVAGKSLKGHSYGPFMDIAMGIGGAVAAGFIMRSAGFSGYRGTAITTLVAMTAAVLLTLVAGFVNGRRLSPRRL